METVGHVQVIAFEEGKYTSVQCCACMHKRCDCPSFSISFSQSPPKILHFAESGSAHSSGAPVGNRKLAVRVARFDEILAIVNRIIRGDDLCAQARARACISLAASH